MIAPERAGELLACAAGIMGFFVFYGFLQEKLMTSPYGDPADEDFDKSKFKDTAFLVMWNRIVAMVVAVAMLAMRKETFRPAAPMQNFFYVSLSNFSATFCQYEGQFGKLPHVQMKSVEILLNLNVI